MPGEGFSKWDYVGLAKHFYEKYQFKNPMEQEKEFFKFIQVILDITENEFENGNLDRLGVWSWCTLSSGKQWPLSKWIKINTVSPYKRAISLLNKFIIK